MKGDIEIGCDVATDCRERKGDIEIGCDVATGCGERKGDVGTGPATGCDDAALIMSGSKQGETLALSNNAFR